MDPRVKPAGDERSRKAETPTRERTCFAVPRELPANKGFSDQSYVAAERRWGLIVHLFHDLPRGLKLSRSASAWIRSAVSKPSVN